MLRRMLCAVAVLGGALIMAVAAFALAVVVEPKRTVCHGTPLDGYCDTHAGSATWLIVALIIGAGLGAAGAALLIRRVSPAPAE
jgi:hypothetical protein